MQEDVFGIKSLLDKEEFEKVYRATGIDVDGRLEFLKKIYSHRERSLMKFITFAKCVEGFSDLSMNDKINLVKRKQDLLIAINKKQTSMVLCHGK